MVSKRGRLEGAYGYLVGGENSAPDRDISYCLEQSEPESAVIVLSRASSAFCFVLVFATRFNMMQYVLAKALVHSHLTAATR